MYKHTTHTVPVIKTILSINSSYREYDEVKCKTQNFPIFREYDEVKYKTQNFPIFIEYDEVKHVNSEDTNIYKTIISHVNQVLVNMNQLISDQK